MSNVRREMSNRYLIGGGMALIGILACIYGFVRLISGTHELFSSSKHPWLSSFFMIFGSYTPYVSAALSFGISVFFLHKAYLAFRSSNRNNENCSIESKYHTKREIENKK